MLYSIALQPSLRMSAWRWSTRQQWVESRRSRSVHDAERRVLEVLLMIQAGTDRLAERAAILAACKREGFAWSVTERATA